MNAWAAAGFKLDRPEEVEAARALAVARAEATGPTLTALQLQAYVLEEQEATRVYGRRRARRRLEWRCLSGTAAFVYSMLSLLTAGFIIWGDYVEARCLPSPSRPPFPKLPPLACRRTFPPHPFPICEPCARGITHFPFPRSLLPNPCKPVKSLPASLNRRCPCSPRRCGWGPFFAAASAARSSSAGSSSSWPRSLEAHSDTRPRLHLGLT